MLFFLLRPHQARGLSLEWWQSLVHGSPISRWEDVDVDEDDNKGKLLVERCEKDLEEGRTLERRRKIVVLTLLHILQWTDQPQVVAHN